MHELPLLKTPTRLAVGFGQKRAALSQFIRSWRNDLDFTPMTHIKEINYGNLAILVPPFSVIEIQRDWLWKHVILGFRLLKRFYPV